MLGAALYIEDAQSFITHTQSSPKSSLIQTSHCNYLLTAICTLCHSPHPRVIQLAALQERAEKRRQLYTRGQNQEC